MYSKVNQLYIFIYPFFPRFFSHISYYRVLSRVPCAMQVVLVSYLSSVLRRETVLTSAAHILGKKKKKKKRRKKKGATD